jgi:hypothetical protein
VTLVVALWGIGILLATFLTVPFGWQRYYLSLQLPLALVMGLGGGTLLQFLAQKMPRRA